MKKRVVIALVVAFAMTLGTALVIWANVPPDGPPPVNQRLGIVDGIFNNLVEADCRACHENPSQFPSVMPDKSIPDRHHLLTLPPTNLQCLDCHSFVTLPDGTVNITVTRNCLASGCHQQIAGQASVHHLAAKAQAGDCKVCHGSLVQNMSDGHYIPTYAPSLVTPKPSGGGGAINPINNAGKGACNYCHDAGTNTDQGKNQTIVSNSDTHHSTGFGLDTTKCTWCHNFTVPSNQKIRVCEGCHGPGSLHNIQASSQTPPLPIIPGGEHAYYGHIGNNDDCNGCHQGFRSAASTYFGPTIPVITTLSPNPVTSGQDTELTINGMGFINYDGSGTEVKSVVVLNGSSGSITLQPTYITVDTIVVTIPSTLAAGNYDLRVVKMTQTSNKEVLSVVPPVIIGSITTSNGVATITGSGFGTTPLGVTDNGNACSISSWSDTQIVANCQTINNGDTIKVKALFGTVSQTVGSVEPPTPQLCTYIYSGWSECQYPGIQTRTVAKSPLGCIENPAPDLLIQDCTYTPPTCTYQYSGWGPCQSDNTQTRTYTEFPDGCKEDPAPDPLIQDCTYTPPTCTYKYLDWGPCQSDNTQTRTVISSSPDGCAGTPEITQTCTYTSNQPPVANAGPDKQVRVNRSLRLDGSASKDPDGKIIKYEWNFSDGSSASGMIVYRTFTKRGTYKVTLTVTDDKSASGTDTAVIRVY